MVVCSTGAGVGIASALAFALAALVEAGPMFGFDRLAPDFNKINPIEGLKQRFGLQAGVDFLRMLVKAVALSGAGAALLQTHARDLALLPSADLDGAARVALRLGLLLAGVATLLSLLSGLVDLKISRGLFNRRNRMTDTDMKREQKEDFGAPELRQQRQEARQELKEAPKPPSLDDLHLLICGRDAGFALTDEILGFSPPRLIVFAQGAELETLRQEARRRGARIVLSDEAVVALKGARRGLPIPVAAFAAVGAVWGPK